MELNNNLMSQLLTGKQRLMGFVSNLRQAVTDNSKYVNQLEGLIGIIGEVLAGQEVDEIVSYNNFKDMVDAASANLPNFTGNLDDGSILDIRTESVSTGVQVNAYMHDVDDETDILSSYTLLEYNTQQRSYSVVNPDDKILHTIADYSLADICNQMVNSTTTLKIAEAATDLYVQGQLTVSNLLTKIDGYVDVVRTDCKEFLDVLIKNFTVATASYSSFISFISSLFSKLSGTTGSGGSFHYGVDQYNVDTSVFIGVNTIINIVSSVLSTIAAIFNPILGVATMAIGKVAETITSMVKENTRSTSLLTDDPSFPGLGQNVARTRVADNDNILYHAFSGGEGIIVVQTPLSTILVYNNPVKNAQNIDVYPVQEFIIPFIPATAELATMISNFATNGNTTNIVDGSFTVDGIDYYQCAYGISGQGGAYSSQAKRALKYYEIMRVINENPNSIITFSDDNYDDNLIKIGTWISHVLYAYAMYDLSSEYMSNAETSNTYLLQSQLNYSNVSSVDDILNATYLFRFCIMMRGLAKVLTSHPFNDVGTRIDWIRGILYQDPSGQPYRTYRITEYNITWAKLINNVLPSKLAYNTLFSSITGTTEPLIPFYVVPLDCSDPLNPQIVPPEAQVNIWARVAITLGVIAATAVTAVVTAVVIRKAAQKSFYRNAASASAAYNTWLETGSQSDWKKYKKANIKTNLIGRIFGLGTYDAQNSWINRPEQGAGSIMNSISTLSGNVNGVVSPSVKDIVDLIH